MNKRISEDIVDTDNAQKSVFIVDDDTDDCTFLKDALMKKAFAGKLETFGNGSQLLDRLNGEHFTNLMIVLDLNMPVKNGFETLKEIKDNNLLQHIPVVVLSATSRIADKEYCQELGCNAFLTKPLNYQQYENVAETILRIASGS